MTTRGIVRLLILAIVLTGVPAAAMAGVLLKLGDILVAEPGTDSISVVDPSTGEKTVISQGGLLSPAHKAVGVAVEPNFLTTVFMFPVPPTSFATRRWSAFTKS
jgi:hypothetical protein